MSRARIFAAAVAFTTGGLAGPAAAHGPSHGGGDCAATFRDPPEVVAEMDAPLAGREARQPFRLEIVGDAGPDCRYVVTLASVEPDARLTGAGGDKLHYVVAEHASGRDAVFDSRRPFDGAGPHGGAARLFGDDVRLYLIVEPGASPRAGRHDARLLATLRDGRGGPELDSVEFPIAVEVAPQVRGYLSGASIATHRGGYALLDLGELEEGVEGRARLTVESTGDVDISFESVHGGRLARLGDGDYSVGYEFYAADRRVDFDAELAERFSPEHHSARTVVPLRVRVSDVERGAAGDYADRITITITAQ